MDQCRISEVSDYLDGSLSFATLRKHGLGHQDLVAGRVYCAVSPPPRPSRKRVTPSGWGSFTPPRPLMGKLVIAPLAGKSQPVVCLKRANQAWSFWPSLDRIMDDKLTFMEVSSPWVEVLCRLAHKTLDPLLYYESSVEWINEGIQNEIHARLLAFENRGPYHFFSDFGEATAWYIAAEWDRWSQARTPESDRLRQLNKYAQIKVKKTDFKLKATDFLGLHPSSALAALKRRDRVFPEISGQIVDQPFRGTSSSLAINQLQESMAKLQMFSKGKGSTMANQSLIPITLPSKRDQASLRNSGIWWWRTLYENSSPEELEEFKDNWEWSAFFYEFRARLKPKDGLPSWRGFGRPWTDLDYSQRGILYNLWPPAPNGDYLRISPRLRSVSSYLKFMLKVDFARPLDEILDEVRTTWKALQPELVHHLGIARPPTPATKQPSKRSLSATIPEKWSLLEALDAQHWLGTNHYKLSKDDKVTYTRQVEDYQAACREAGISP